MTSAEDEIRSEFAKLENLERRRDALRGLAASLTPARCTKALDSAIEICPVCFRQHPVPEPEPESE